MNVSDVAEELQKQLAAQPQLKKLLLGYARMWRNATFEKAAATKDIALLQEAKGVSDFFKTFAGDGNEVTVPLAVLPGLDNALHATASIKSS